MEQNFHVFSSKTNKKKTKTQVLSDKRSSGETLSMAVICYERFKKAVDLKNEVIKHDEKAVN